MQKLAQERRYLASLSLLTDADFLAQFDAAINGWLAEHLKETEQQYRESEDKQWPQDRAAFVAAAQQLKTAVHAFYRAHVAFAEKSVGKNPDREAVLSVYRAQLRAYVVRDLNVLAANMCSWLPGVEPIRLAKDAFVEAMSCMGRFTPELDEAGSRALVVRRRVYEQRRNAVRNILRDKREEYELISGYWFYDPRGDSHAKFAPTYAVAEFDAAEKAWRNYAEVMRKVHTPVWKFHFTGTGTSNMIQMMQIQLIDSRELYLTELLSQRLRELRPFMEEAAAAGETGKVEFLNLQVVEDAPEPEDAEDDVEEEEAAEEEGA